MKSNNICANKTSQNNTLSYGDKKKARYYVELKEIKFSNSNYVPDYVIGKHQYYYMVFNA